MAEITEEYLEELAPVYRDILKTIPMFHAQGDPEGAVAIQSLYSVLLDDGYTLRQIREACEQMEQGGAVEIRNRIFVIPTELGWELIKKLTGETPGLTVPPFIPPPGRGR